ncbi:tetratricopeptide repeat protein [Mycobacterium hodleri]|uniref:tetratricopeptide repeat protein n=1 Tax=Mycolicibacterium hodleri TaxID=49897 RepID=UPI0021F3239E|nr:tetratricopeptide repeat protein [Mycolicibacterium hodleri]MCV7133352.1 tetratricopeptide repeat protein [Mycolicibacterium hodleri]
MTAAGDTDGVVALATAYADARNHARAEEVLREALVTAPDNAVLLANLARVQVLTRQYDAAARNAYAALAISPEYGFAMRIYAVALDAAGRVDQALYMAWRGVAAQPRDRLAHFVYAEMLLKVGRPHDALFVVGEALRLDPTSADSHVLRGQILARLGRSEESTSAYEQALQLDPANASAVHNIGVNRLARSKWSAALSGFLGAARLDPDLGDLARRNIGITLARLLRLATVGVLVLGWVIIVSIPAVGQGTSPDVGHRIAVGVCTLALLAYAGWLSRVVPMRTWRSVLRTQRPLALRVGLLVGAIPLGVLAVVSGGLTVVEIVGPVLLFGAVVVTVVARFAGG